MPIGQLDGGHIIYCMFPKYYKKIAKIFFVLLLVFGTIGIFPVLEYYEVLQTSGYSPFTDWLMQFGSVTWLIWALLIMWIIKIQHPDTLSGEDDKLDTTRVAVGLLCIIIFITSFTPRLAYDIN
jgi:hypothetical protein